VIIGIVGGQLQGLEAVYLAREAGFRVFLMDKDPLVPAGSLADEFFHLDVLSEEKQAGFLLKKVDLILPATENYGALCRLNDIARQENLPLALDLAAYKISSSKIESNRLFSRVGIAMPEPWPECGFPVMVKPSSLSGSAGVAKVNDQEHLLRVLKNMGGNVVIQRYLTGPSYSLEVLAHKGRCVCLQVTELHFDARYDCKRVLAGPATGTEVEEDFHEMGRRIAAALNLSGIMDIEVINDKGKLKVLEIDARLPSQTPSVVYHSTGVNMVELLSDYWVRGMLPLGAPSPTKKRAVVYEHLHFHDGVMEVSGEHVLVGAKGLKIHRGQFYADLFISNFEENPENWVGTVIFTDEDEDAVWEKRGRAIALIQKTFKAREVLDPKPSDD
jgi:pyrrolysine biosynthesis protein PylC